MRRQPLATDHRALVLESVATNPKGATTSNIVEDCKGDGFDEALIKKHIWQLRKEGLIGLRDPEACEFREFVSATHFITQRGLIYLTDGRFDLPIPVPGHPRPKARKRKTQ